MNMVSLMGGKVTTDLYVKPTDSQPSISPLLMSPNPHHCNNRKFHTTQALLPESAQILILLIEDAMILKNC